MVPAGDAAATLPGVDAVTVAILGAVVVFAVLHWLRWRSKAAWFRRVTMEREHADEVNEGTEGEREAER